MGRWPHTAAAAPGHAPLSLVGMSIWGWPQPGALPTSGAACDPAQGRAASCAAPPPILIPIPAFWGVEEVTARIPCAAPCVAVAAAG